MKIQHWAIIFIIIILPISIICRNTITKKNLLLRDETRYNNIIDNATYDAVSQIVEVAEELAYGKNIPITHGVADAAIDRFFNTLCVNFNLPIGRELAESYFCQYIPAIVIVGYDGLYVYSYEDTASGYDYVLKPKIPYAYTYTYRTADSTKNVTVNFTLDNYVTIYFPDDEFMKDMPDENGVIDTDGINILKGYVGENLDLDQNGIDDLNDYFDASTGVISKCVNPANQYTDNDDPFGITGYADNSVEQENYILNTVTSFTDNLSYILKVWADNGSVPSSNTAMYLDIFYSGDVKQDYVYNDKGEVTINASDFNTLRRETIINLITSVLKEEFNEHNTYADYMGMTYNFNIPDIGRDQWNNTIDDISVLAFMQGMPMGADSYYNNYSLGGARIVQANYLYGETIRVGTDEYKVYHKHYCPLINNASGDIIYNDGETEYTIEIPNGTAKTKHIDEVFINASHAKDAGYYICSECM